MYPELNLAIGENIYIFKTYNVFMFFSIFIGLSLSYIQLRKQMRHSILFLVSLIISFIIGARLLNYLVNYSFYENNAISIFEFKAIGFSFYGGVLASVICLILLSKTFKNNTWSLTDQMILPFGISFFIMRIGCFLNGCCFGQTTTCFLGVQLPQETFNSIFQIFSNTIKIHPTQLYEGFGALLGVMFLVVYKKIIKREGLLTLYYGVYLTGIRWFVLYFRQLQYDPWVLIIFYPMLYLTLIILGLILIWELKYNAREANKYECIIKTFHNQSEAN
jgi:phosphatidylglycerol:prolipoprotein diacylglycerol transferase